MSGTQKRKGTPAAATPALPETRTVPIKSLLRDPRFQVRTRLDDVTVSRYANAIAEGCMMPPIRVAAVNSALVVVDGWHRLAAYERRGMGMVEAEIIVATEHEAQWLAAVANMAHGLPLRTAEIRTAFRAMIKARKHIVVPTVGAIKRGTLQSYRELAVMLGGLVRHTTLRNWMQADFPRIARSMTNLHGDEAQRKPIRDDDGIFFNAAIAALETAGANSGGVLNAERRGTMIEATEKLLKHLRQARPFTLSEF